MILAFPEDSGFATRFNIGSGDSESGPRIGGRAPANVSSPNIQQGEFFATVPVTTSPALEASIFLNLGCFGEPAIAPRGSVSAAGHEFVEIFVSQPSKRRSDSSFVGPLSEHPLIFKCPEVDVEVEDPSEVGSGHKLGGLPFLIQRRATLVQQLDSIAKDGYRHVAQFDFIVPGDADWTGNWPFGDGLFHIFGKPPYEGNTWLWLWQI